MEFIVVGLVVNSAINGIAKFYNLRENFRKLDFSFMDDSLVLVVGLCLEEITNWFQSVGIAHNCLMQ